MYRDFVVLPAKAWIALHLWYGGGSEYPRKVIIHNSIPSIELYPPRITCVLADAEGKPVSDSQRSLFVSTAMTLSEVHLKICESFNYISTRDTRLWIKDGQQAEGQNQWRKVQGSPDEVSKPKEDFIAIEGDLFMVEVKFYGNQWPLDKEDNKKARDWR